ncbi:16S rRNA (cytidine(1402)-2'-O)-methyltransferase [Qipengyuania thermophila]|uniref:16S rRNA (cytidine(1402)-2'-O)-methyltransferase n=1 Tax=Qipengyuania thermophila TaxID=2509361 RepID=UPI001F228536|nr:16S rRNA (cytidine(1402)-2'-O)-methyltransferase [Qipengyuania thermophila]
MSHRRDPSAERQRGDAMSGPLAPGLYIVATPIGNLRDITLRAVDVLSHCELVACEDTRVTGRLLQHLGVSRPLQRLDDHAGEAVLDTVLNRARTGAVALVSDAGTPLISDPGFRLVREARRRGLPVFAVPGPAAAMAALSIAGLPTDRFLFAGFLPAKEAARAEVLRELQSVRATVVFYETAPRLLRSLSQLAELWPDRACAVCRELTKLHEECRTGSAAELLAHFAEHPPRGEIVLLAGPPVDRPVALADADDLLREALGRSKPSKAAAEVARATGLDRRELYARARTLTGG